MAHPRASASPARWQRLSDEEVLHRLASERSDARREAWGLAIAVASAVEEAAQLRGASVRKASGVRLSHLGTQVGLSSSRARAAAERLRQNGVLQSGRELVLSEAVMQPAIGRSPDWSRILRQLEGDLSAIVVLRAHSLLVSSDEWVPVELGEVAHLSGYTEATVRRARAALEEQSLLESRPVPGAATEYRLPSLVWGEDADPVPFPTPASVSQTAPAPAAGTGITLEVQGVTIEVAPGAGPVRFEIDDAGRQVVRVGDVVLRSR